MKTLLTTTALLMTFGLGGAALASPGHGGHGKHRGDRDRDRYAYDDGYGGDREGGWDDDRRGWDDDRRGWDDDRRGWDDDRSAYDLPDFEVQVRRGVTFRRIKRMMRARMRARIARKSRRIHARFGYNRYARRMIRRMKRRERARFQRRLSFVRARFDELREARVYVEPAPSYTYAPPVYDGSVYVGPSEAPVPVWR